MFHPITQRCWVPLALVAMLCGVVALVPRPPLAPKKRLRLR